MERLQRSQRRQWAPLRRVSAVAVARISWVILRMGWSHHCPFRLHVGQGKACARTKPSRGGDDQVVGLVRLRGEEGRDASSLVSRNDAGNRGDPEDEVSKF